MSFLTKKFVLVAFLFFVFLLTYQSKAQCNINSSCGYSVTVNVNPISIIPSSTACAFGYNYNVRFRYTVSAVGTNTCSSGTLGVQPQIFCNSGQNNGYYTINNPIPNGPVSVSNSGTLITTTNPYRSASDCATATPTSLNCNQLQITIFGPGISTITFTCNFSTLPIELFDFYATKMNGGIILNWVTASEKNSSFFTLERSADGEEWVTVDNIKAWGTTSEKKQYKTTDNSFYKGLNYYRLKQTDFDGIYQYSGILVVDGTNSESNIRIFPNPSNGEFRIESKTDSPKQLQLTNLQGELLLRQTMYFKSTLDLNNYPVGIYFIKITDGGSESHHKLIKN